MLFGPYVYFFPPGVSAPIFVIYWPIFIVYPSWWHILHFYSGQTLLHRRQYSLLQIKIGCRHPMLCVEMSPTVICYFSCSPRVHLTAVIRCSLCPALRPEISCKFVRSLPLFQYKSGRQEEEHDYTPSGREAVATNPCICPPLCQCPDRWILLSRPLQRWSSSPFLVPLSLLRH